jgi:TDG/mug DNA glycosylase family protein
MKGPADAAGLRVPVLEDVLASDLKVLFCGTAPGTRSAQVGAYYAHPGNRFWNTLHETGLTPRRVAPADFRAMPSFGLGLTDLAKHVYGADATLRADDFSPAGVRELVERWRPRIVAFTSKRAGRAFHGRAVDYGLQEERMGATRFFVLTSPSGLATGFWQGGRHWHELATLAGVPVPTATATATATACRR